MSKNQWLFLTSGREGSRRVGRDCLEAALRIPEAGQEHRPEEQTVSPRRYLARQAAANHIRSGKQPRTDSDVVFLLRHRGNDFGQVLQTGGQVHVHVTAHVRVAFQPCPLEGAAAAALFQPGDAHPIIHFRQFTGNFWSSVGRPIVCDRELPVALGVVIDELCKRRDAPGQGALFIQYRNHYVDGGVHFAWSGMYRPGPRGAHSCRVLCTVLLFLESVKEVADAGVRHGEP